MSSDEKVQSVQSASEGVPSSRCRLSCDCNQASEISFYCQDHDDVSCQACSLIKHTTCKTVPVSEQSASYSTAKFSTLDERASKLSAEIDEILNERKSNQTISKSLKEKAKNDIKYFREEINRQMDVMEQNILKELEERDSKNQLEVDGHISSCTTTKQILETDLKLINDIIKTGSKIDMLSLDVRLSKRLKEYERLLQDVREETKALALTFNRNEELVDMLEDIEVLGTLREEEVDLTQRARKFSDLRVHSINQVDVKLPGDTRVPVITGCVFLPSGQIVLCDYKNNKLKLLSKSFTLKGHLELPSRPWDIAVFNSSTAIVTLPKKTQLQYIEVLPKLKPGRVLQLDQDCRGVEVADGEIYVTCIKGASKGEGEVKILDQDGNVKRTLGIKEDGTFMFEFPYYPTVNVKSKRIYISDDVRDTVTCLKPDGTVIYQYKDTGLKSPRGVCVDDDDNIFICSRSSNTVHIVTADGQKQKIIPTVEDIYPESVAYRHADDTLVIGCWGRDKLFVYKFTHG